MPRRMMTRKMLALVSAGGLVLYLGSVPGCSRRGATFLVPADSLFVVTVPRLKDLVNGPKAYLAKFMTIPAVSAAYEKLKGQLLERTGVDIDKLETAQQKGIDIDGAAAISMGPDKSVSLVVGVADRKALEKTLRELAAKISGGRASFGEKDVSGVKITTLSFGGGKPLAAWGYVKKFLVLCPSARGGDPAERVARLAKLEKSIEQNAVFKRVRSALGDKQVFGYLDSEAADKLRKAQQAELAKGAPEWLKKRMQARMGRWDALMAYVAGYGFTIDFAEKRVTNRAYLAMPPDKGRQIAALFEGVGDAPGFVKLIGSDALGVARLSLNPKKLFDWLLTLVPQRTKRRIYRQQERFERRTKINVQNDILGLLSGRAALAVFAPKEPSGQLRGVSSLVAKIPAVLMVQVTDAKKAAELLATIEKMLVMARVNVRTKKEGDQTIYLLEGGPVQVGATLVENKKLVVIGVGGRLQQTLELFKGKGDDVLGTIDSARARQLLKSENGTVVFYNLPKTAKFLSGLDLPNQAKVMAVALAKAASMTFALEVKKEGVLFEMEDGVTLLAAIAVPAFIKYLRKSKTVEATEALDKIKIGAKMYYQADHYDKSGNLLPKRFPPSSPQTPAKVPCGRPEQSPSAVWQTEGWRALQFQLTDPHYYSYSFHSSGTNKSAQFVARAIGDLDCDGVYSTYEIRGSVDQEFGVRVRGPIITNELE